jgi:hypothetical protein
MKDLRYGEGNNMNFRSRCDFLFYRISNMLSTIYLFFVYEHKWLTYLLPNTQQDVFGVKLFHCSFFFSH